MQTMDLTGHEKRYIVFHSLIFNEAQNGNYAKLLNELHSDNPENIQFFKIIPREIIYMIIDYLLRSDKDAAINLACTCSFVCGMIEYLRFKDKFDYQRVRTLMRNNGSIVITDLIMKTIMSSDIQDVCKLITVFDMAIEHGCVNVISIILESRKFRSEAVFSVESGSPKNVEILDLSSSSESTEIIVGTRKFQPSKEYIIECFELAIKHKQYTVIKYLLDHPSFEPSVNESFWIPTFTEEHEKHYFKVEAFRDAVDNNHNNIRTAFWGWRLSFLSL